MQIDQRLLKILREVGVEGIEQSIFSQRVNLPEKKFQSVIEPLVQAGYVDRKLIDKEGKKTFWFFPIEQLLNWGGIGACPCVNCLELERCGVGQMISPENCQDLFVWVVKESQGL